MIQSNKYRIIISRQHNDYISICGSYKPYYHETYNYRYACIDVDNEYMCSLKLKYDVENMPYGGDSIPNFFLHSVITHFAVDLRDYEKLRDELTSLGYSIHSHRVHFSGLFYDPGQITQEDYVYIQLKYNIKFPTEQELKIAFSY